MKIFHFHKKFKKTTVLSENLNLAERDRDCLSSFSSEKEGAFPNKCIYEHIGAEAHDLCAQVDEFEDDSESSFIVIPDSRSEDDLIDEITSGTGWCIKSIDFMLQLK